MMKINLQNKALQNTGLSVDTLSIILGGILGDGSLKLHNGYKNARYSFRHSITQQAYFYWKAARLKEISAPKATYIQDPDDFSKNQKLRYCSGARESLTKLLKITHKGNKISVQRNWLNHLTPLSLAIWWCDDGSLLQANRCGVLATCGLTKNEHDIIIQYFKTVWQVNFKKYLLKTTYTDKDGVVSQREYYSLYLITSEYKKFMEIIMPYIPCKEMVYKCTLRYKDQQCQERWISRMEELLPEDLKMVPRSLLVLQLPNEESLPFSEEEEVPSVILDEDGNVLSGPEEPES